MKAFMINVIKESQATKWQKTVLPGDCYGSYYQIVPVEVRTRNVRYHGTIPYVVQHFYDLERQQKVVLRKEIENVWGMADEKYKFRNGELLGICVDLLDNCNYKKCYPRIFDTLQEAEKEISTQRGFAQALYWNYG